MKTVYVDMVADLFHRGHVEFLKKAKTTEADVYIIAGIHSYEDCRLLKRRPIYSMEDRVAIVGACRYVDKVIPSAPLEITEEFLKAYKIDIVVHGDDMNRFHKNVNYRVPIELGIMRTVPRYKKMSTTEIIKKIRGELSWGKIKHKRLDAALGENELREYLENKQETSKAYIETEVKPEYREYGKPMTDIPNILLVFPPITIPKYMQKRCIPPLGLSYIAAMLEKSGIRVAVLDCCVEGYEQERENGNLVSYGLSQDQLKQRLKDYAPDVIGISSLFSTDLNNFLDTARILHETFPKAVVVAGGLHPTIYPKEIFDIDVRHNGERTIDFILRGEGEYRLTRFIKLLQKGLVDINSDGLVGYINDEFIYNHQRAMIGALDDLPSPAYHLLPMEKYFEINVPFAPLPYGKRVMQILVSRGCPVGCTFCASTNMAKRHRTRSVDNIIAEIKKYQSVYDIDEIQFADDNLTLDKSHATELFSKLKKCNIKWCTPNGVMINTISMELLDIMADSGLYQITLSLDSANDKTLKELHHKPVRLDNIPHIIERCREHGIFTHGTLVVGMPEESLDDINETFGFVLNNLELTSLSTFIASAIPGSELYHKALEEGLISREEAALIDTTKCKMSLSGIDPSMLEKMVMDFQQEYTKEAMDKNPEEYERKYRRLIISGSITNNHGGRLT